MGGAIRKSRKLRRGLLDRLLPKLDAGAVGVGAKHEVPGTIIYFRVRIHTPSMFHDAIGYLGYVIEGKSQMREAQLVHRTALGGSDGDGVFVVEKLDRDAVACP